MKNMRRMIGPALLIAGVVALVSVSATAQRAARRVPAAAEAETQARVQVKRLSRVQLENVEARVNLANSIVDRLQGQAGSSRAEIWRRSTLESLLPLSLRALEQVHRDAHSIDALATAMRAAADDPNLLGDPSADLVYTPINPCRYIDTRGGPIVVPATPRGYDLAFNGATYGGSAACSLPQTVTAAIAMNVTITEPVGAPAFLAVKPTLAAPTTSFMNWYESGLSVQLANAGVVTVDQSGAANEFFILVSSPTHVIVDFFGFFAEPQATALQTTIASDSIDCPIGGNCTNLSPACPAGYALTGGGCSAEHFAHLLVQSQPSGGSWFCASDNNSGAISFLLAEAVCARVPGR